MSENPVALVTTQGHATVIVRLPAALASDESVSSSESELRYVIERGKQAAGQDARSEIAVDGPEVIGTIHIQGPVDANKKLQRPDEEQRKKVVSVVQKELYELGYDINPDSTNPIKAENSTTRMNNFLDNVLGGGI